MIVKDDKIMKMQKMPGSFKYDVSLSYASEDLEIARNLAQKLEKMGIRVFFAAFYQYELWGKSLRKVLSKAFGPETRFVVLLISKYYPAKDWTDFEFSVSREEAKKRKNEFILPVRLDDTKMPGIHNDIVYLDYRELGIDGIVNCLLEKLSMRSSDQI